MSQTVDAYGIRFDIPDTWSSRVIAPYSDGQESSGVVVHAGSFAIPFDEGSYGSMLMGQLGPGDLAFALLEMLSDGELQPGQGIYAGAPPTSAAALAFDSETLHVVRPDQLGTQAVFSVGDRAFVLYAVMGSSGALTALPGLTQVLSTLHVDAA